ncbi:MAG: small nuclear ribonucleoprotein-associated protein [archaeon]|nr:small nuclear ribonucleoprotein-associated protein [archaeon]
MWINYRIRVTIQDSRVIVGTFLAFDKHMNLVLSDTDEYSTVRKKGSKEYKEIKRTLGLILLRGDNIISISAEAPTSQNTNKMIEIQKTGVGSSMAVGRGIPINAGQSGLNSVGRGIGIPNLMPNQQMMMGRGSQIPFQGNNVNNIPNVRPPMRPPKNISGNE